MNFNRYKSTKLTFLILIVLLILCGLIFLTRESFMPFLHSIGMHTIQLPQPVYRSNTSVEEALKQRRSNRHFKNETLNLQQVAQLLWAAQGLSSATGFRTTPSAGGLYPLEIYIVSGNIQDLPAGVYHYSPLKHALELIVTGDKRKELAVAAQEQNAISGGAIDLVIAANNKKTSRQYGTRSERFIAMEVGHAAENIYLQTVSLGLGTESIGVFDETAVKRIIGLPREEEPFYIMPIGKPLESNQKLNQHD